MNVKIALMLCGVFMLGIAIGMLSHGRVAAQATTSANLAGTLSELEDLLAITVQTTENGRQVRFWFGYYPPSSRESDLDIVYTNIIVHNEDTLYLGKTSDDELKFLGTSRDEEGAQSVLGAWRQR